MITILLTLSSFSSHAAKKKETNEICQNQICTRSFFEISFHTLNKTFFAPCPPTWKKHTVDLHCQPTVWFLHAGGLVAKKCYGTHFNEIIQNPNCRTGKNIIHVCTAQFLICTAQASAVLHLTRFRSDPIRSYPIRSYPIQCSKSGKFQRNTHFEQKKQCCHGNPFSWTADARSAIYQSNWYLIRYYSVAGRSNLHVKRKM